MTRWWSAEWVVPCVDAFRRKQVIRPAWLVCVWLRRSRPALRCVWAEPAAGEDLAD